MGKGNNRRSNKETKKPKKEKAKAADAKPSFVPKQSHATSTKKDK